ncbi:hypothetical protein AAVH_22197 [Aphelenchoides avenae]|nr:hypothetical protein AAVH_22197 [Aphelenchus avenae]
MAPEAVNIWNSNCDETQVQVASPYSCDEAKPNDVTLSDAATDMWHDGGGRYFRVEERKACYIEANKTCERHGGTLIHLDDTALTWISNNLGTGGYALWIDYQAVDKGVVNDDDTRTCTFRPLHGSGTEIQIAKDLCLYCECLIAWVEVLDETMQGLPLMMQPVTHGTPLELPSSSACSRL